MRGTMKTVRHTHTVLLSHVRDTSRLASHSRVYTCLIASRIINELLTTKRRPSITGWSNRRNNARNACYLQFERIISRVLYRTYIYILRNDHSARCSMDDSLLGQYLKLETPVGPVTRRGGLFLRVIDKPRMCVHECVFARRGGISSVRVDDDDNKEG